jgi:hypothetical protein
MDKTLITSLLTFPRPEIYYYASYQEEKPTELANLIISAVITSLFQELRAEVGTLTEEDFLDIKGFLPFNGISISTSCL